MHVNLRGFKSKELSLRKIVKKINPGLVTLNETFLTGNMKISIAPYVWWTKNRPEKGGGGVATGVSQAFRNSAVGAGEGEGDDEYLITRIESFYPALNLINCYGEQRRTSKEEVEAKWGRIRSAMERIRARQEFCCLQGDLNKLVGQGKFGVEGNNPEISLGGRLLRDLLETGNWVLVNGLGQDIVKGGPFTRKDPATGIKSCLDLFIVSIELLPFVKQLKIDSDQELAVGRAVKRGQNYRVVKSDHFTCFLTLEGLPRIQERKQEDQVIWNLASEGG